MTELHENVRFQKRSGATHDAILFCVSSVAYQVDLLLLFEESCRRFEFPVTEAFETNLGKWRQTSTQIYANFSASGAVRSNECEWVDPLSRLRAVVSPFGMHQLHHRPCKRPICVGAPNTGNTVTLFVTSSNLWDSWKIFQIRRTNSIRVS